MNYLKTLSLKMQNLTTNQTQSPSLQRQPSRSRTPIQFYERPETPVPTRSPSPQATIFAPTNPFWTFPRICPPTVNFDIPPAYQNNDRMIIDHHYNDQVDGTTIRNYYRCSRGHIVSVNDSDEEYPDPPEIVCSIRNDPTDYCYRCEYMHTEPMHEPIKGMDATKFALTIANLEDQYEDVVLKRKNKLLFDWSINQYCIRNNFE